MRTGFVDLFNGSGFPESAPSRFARKSGVGRWLAGESRNPRHRRSWRGFHVDGQEDQRFAAAVGDDSAGVEEQGLSADARELVIDAEIVEVLVGRQDFLEQLAE